MGSENSERSISKTQNAQNKAETYKGNFLQPSLHHLDCEKWSGMTPKSLNTWDSSWIRPIWVQDQIQHLADEPIHHNMVENPPNLVNGLDC